MLELRPDAVIAGRLRLLAPLGQGGMGVVWSARQLSLDAVVAVKFIRPDRAADPALLARFEREAKAAARIAHPHVVGVSDFGTADGIPYIVMELLRGASLAELLSRGGRLSFATAKSLVRQVGGALESAHEQGIVHRDIKPHNVFITEGSRDYPLFVKVLDFGVAKIVGDSELPGASGALTETGTIIGSPPYMSPEQLEGSRDVDFRSDLWSLGVIVYEALTGTPPFRGGSFVSVGAAVLRGRYRPVSELRLDLPPTIDDWFAKALSVDPQSRYGSARQMVDAFVDQQELPSDTPSSTPLGPVREQAAAHATTVEAPSPAPTESHEPAAAAPASGLELSAAESVEAPSAPRRPAAVRSRSRPSGRARLAMTLLVGAAVAAGGVGLVRAVRPSSGASCPADMVLVSGATFRMGAADGAETPTDETPAHMVTVEPFCLERTEVTLRAYLQCERCPPALRTVEFEGLTPNGRAFMSQFCNGADAGDHPINCVDWNQAKAYCAAHGRRLPTEAEWELAARGVDERLYPWGLDAPAADRLNACGVECSRMLTERLAQIGKGPWPTLYPDDDGAPATAAVGRHPAGASAAGVLDLAGNVWEWTESSYCPYGDPDCNDSRRVLRGGGWDSTERVDVRATRRYPSAPTARGRSIGFRCASSR